MTEVMSDTPIRDKVHEIRTKAIYEALVAASKRQRVCQWKGIALEPRNTVVIEYWPNGGHVVDVVHFSRWEDIKLNFYRLCAALHTKYVVLDGRSLREFQSKDQ